MIQIFFIRHGATAGNLEKRYIGRTDEPLCELGVSQVKKLKKFSFPIEHLYVSPSLRTRQTAQLLFPGIAPVLVDDLIETDFGAFEGKSAEELSGESAYQAWVDSCCMDPIPDGECIADFKTRCCGAFQTVMKELPDDGTAAFVIHGGVIMSILEAYACPAKGFYDYHIGNGEYIECSYQNGIIRVLQNP